MRVCVWVARVSKLCASTSYTDPLMYLTHSAIANQIVCDSSQVTLMFTFLLCGRSGQEKCTEMFTHQNLVKNIFKIK